MSPFRTAIWRTAIYLVFGFLWILYSDRFLEQIVDNTETLTQMQTYKGWFFVTMTGLLFFFLMHSALKRERRLFERDNLTCLLNRHVFSQELDVWIRQSEQNDQILVAILNIDEFRQINHTAGSRAGDDLLIATSELIAQAGNGDRSLVARIGADEFAIAIPLVNSFEHYIERLREVQRKVHDLPIDGMPEHHTLISLGIALYPQDALESKALQTSAAIALEEAKEIGGGQLRVYDHVFGEAVHNRLKLSHDLKAAIANDEFHLVYQPQFDCCSLRITGVEALLRWTHPHFGPIRPDVFISLAEQQGMITAITDYVCKQAIEELTHNQLMGEKIPRLSINVSALDFEGEECHENFFKKLEGLSDWSQLQLELTETAITKNFEKSQRALDILRRAKLQVSIDDFGTGYSSLSLLQRLPVHEVKIDRSFISDIPNNEDSCNIVRTIIAMSRTMHLRVVAEGVETNDQLAFLQAEGCDEVQGFYLAKPMPIRELITFCEHYTAEPQRRQQSSETKS
ncbi:putative bifunctional diguanylate cyclase/phosphodiesterase [Aliidiomarina sanyensis]|uniref:GGDEF-domain containing protein n=1 Tax=Aliidiomarina sanyensis TaxID=1249555 RepID=A0A432WKL1_9GAMM|nr:bifunctional diguanylate cyclase/phosphodiesterase [Aliidiomarina sanyensis]RUO34229.1 hypothetical protein CWE11_05735 [Aliidiomarina sanyensis]